MTDQSELTIESICELTGISRSTVYQYLRMGILPPPVRIAPKKLRYDQTHLDRIAEIKRLRSQKLALSDIQKKLKLEHPADADQSPEDLKLQIMRSAARILAQKGISKMTISDITETMGIGKGTFYLYFNSKEELFLESIERLPEIAIPDQTSIDIKTEDDFIAICAKRSMNMLQTFNVFSGISTIAKSAILGEDRELAKKAARGVLNLSAPVAVELRQGINSGFFNEMNEDLIAFTLYHIAEGIGFWHKIYPDSNGEETIESVIDLFLKGIRNTDSTGALQPPPMQIKAVITDKSGSRIRISNPVFDNKNLLCGRLGQGELSVSIDRIRSISFKNEKGYLNASVKMIQGEGTRLQVRNASLLSGNSPYGIYSIELQDIDQINFKAID